MAKKRKPSKLEEDRPSDTLGLDEDELKDLLEEKDFGLTTEEPSLDAGDDDPLAGPEFGSPFLEKLLMAIIAAHNLDHPDVRKRLNTAMVALVGRKADPAPFRIEPKYQEERALQWMVRQVVTGRWNIQDCSPEVLKMTILPLARKAVDLFLSSTIVETGRDSAAKRLQETFTGVYAKKLKLGSPDLRTRVYYEVEHDHIRETVEAQQLQKIGEILSSHGIETAFDEIL
jgi:hypothetical protein